MADQLTREMLIEEKLIRDGMALFKLEDGEEHVFKVIRKLATDGCTAMIRLYPNPVVEVSPYIVVPEESGDDVVGTWLVVDVDNPALQSLKL